MEQAVKHCYVVTDDRILSGEPIVQGTRTPVRAVAELCCVTAPGIRPRGTATKDKGFVNQTTRPLTAVTHDAVTALFREIGIAETARFLHQFSLGAGDYTAERREFLGEPPLEEIVSKTRERRVRKDPGAGPAFK